jgi:hypothetical protein
LQVRALPRSLDRRFCTKKPYKTLFFSEATIFVAQDLPNGGFLRLIPRIYPVLDLHREDRKIINSNVLSFFLSGPVDTSQHKSTSVNNSQRQ